MKFPKPRVLIKNEFPDLVILQPVVFKKVVDDKVYPENDSKRDRYLYETVKTLKNRAKQKAKAAKLNEIFINKELYFVPIFTRHTMTRACAVMLLRESLNGFALNAMAMSAMTN